jgi:cholesterol transport system auxiliary component
MNPGARRRGITALLLWLPMLLAGLLAGCGGLLPKAPERTIYRVNPAVALTRAPRRVGALLVVATPTASAGLDTKRIALIRSPVAIEYYADGEWVDRPPFLVKEALIEGFQKSGAFAGVGSEGQGLNADYVLNTDIRDFTAVYDTPDGPPLARVRIAAELIAMPGRNIVAATSVSREARAGAVELPSVVQALDLALGEAVQDVIVWAAATPAVATKRR